MDEVRNFDCVMNRLNEYLDYHKTCLELLKNIKINRKKDGTHFKNVNQTFENAKIICDATHPEIEVSGRNAKGKYVTYDFPVYVYADELPKDDVRLEKVVSAGYGLRDTYCFDTDEIIAEIARLIVKEMECVTSYEKQIECAKDTFDSVRIATRNLHTMVSELTKQFRKREYDKSSLEYALIDYIQYAIRFGE